jgi:hypothetical protein
MPSTRSRSPRCPSAERARTTRDGREGFAGTPDDTPTYVCARSLALGVRRARSAAPATDSTRRPGNEARYHTGATGRPHCHPVAVNTRTRYGREAKMGLLVDLDVTVADGRTRRSEVRTHERTILPVEPGGHGFGVRARGSQGATHERTG